MQFVDFLFINFMFSQNQSIKVLIKTSAVMTFQFSPATLAEGYLERLLKSAIYHSTLSPNLKLKTLR